uniref:Vps53_N domain-containing protein n=1 Tax=Steinernema glaseri TaxID=37863 RepID=A0A1I7Y470_9BILA
MAEETDINSTSFASSYEDALEEINEDVSFEHFLRMDVPDLPADLTSEEKQILKDALENVERTITDKFDDVFRQEMTTVAKDIHDELTAEIANLTSQMMAVFVKHSTNSWVEHRRPERRDSKSVDTTC